MVKISTRITVIDAPCGAGKTEYIIQQINQNEDKPYIYISPLRSMFERMRGKGGYEGRGASRVFYTPQNNNPSGTKLESFKEMIEVGVSIMSTHALFLMIDDEVIQLLRDRSYHLIIDEALCAVNIISAPEKESENEEFEFRELKRPITKVDMDWLLEKGHIRIDANNDNKVLWVDESEEAHRYCDLRRLIKANAVSYIDGTFLIWHFPITALEAFASVTILTYVFSGTSMKYYLDYHAMKYRHLSLQSNGADYTLVDFQRDMINGSEYKEFINICNVDSLNAIGIRGRQEKYPLSSNWYSKADKAKLKALRDNITNYLRHYRKADSNSVMWTTFKSMKGSVSPIGYTKRKDGEESWVFCTCRATEDYIERYNLVYAVDRHIHPGLIKFFAQRGVFVDKDQYALAELLQWLFRSRIRNANIEDRSVYIYIPSKRMRDILENYLGCKV